MINADEQDSERTVLVYRNEILSFSETFIKAQTEALQDFRPILIGLRPTSPALSLETTPIQLTRDRSVLSRFKKALYQYFGIAPQFYRQALATHPCLVHAHFARDGAAALPLVERLGVPLIVTLHGFDVTRKDKLHAWTRDGSIYLRRRQRLWDRTSLFICISDFIRRKAMEVGFPRHKLKVHYTGIDLNSFAPGEEKRRGGLVVFVGRLVEVKGCAYAIRAMQRVAERLPKSELIIIGDGLERASLTALARDLRVPCRFLGAQPSSVVRDTLAQAKVLCVPSIATSDGDEEGLGLVFCEAQAVGTPVVSFSTGGIPEAVRHGETGLLAPERDEAALAGYLLRYLTDEPFWDACSEEGKSWVRENFNLQRQTRKLEDLYREAILESPEGSSGV